MGLGPDRGEPGRGVARPSARQAAARLTRAAITALRVCQPPRSWSPAAALPTRRDPTCDSALGSQSGGTRAPHRSHDSHQACGATARDSLPHDAYSGIRSRLHSSCLLPRVRTAPGRRATPPFHHRWTRPRSHRRRQPLVPPRVPFETDLRCPADPLPGACQVGERSSDSGRFQKDRLENIHRSCGITVTLRAGARPPANNSSSEAADHAPTETERRRTPPSNEPSNPCEPGGCGADSAP